VKPERIALMPEGNTIMDLNQTDMTNLERGIDAALNTIISMAQTSLVKMLTDNPVGAAPFQGFILALQDHRAALANKCLMAALAAHPDIGNADVSLEPTEKEGTVQ
jgi:hypothetical protein